MRRHKGPHEFAAIGILMSDTPRQSQDARLVVEHVRRDFETATGTLTVLKDVSLTLSPSETLAVTGPSGAGKSTLLNIIGSLDKPTSGRVRLADQDVSTLAGADLARFRSTSVGFVFQDHHLLPQCSAIENVVLPTIPLGRPMGASERARTLLDRVGLSDRIHSFPAQLSGGERQRVAIARAMINHPLLLLCDEPTGNLDHEAADRVASLFAELAEEGAVMLVIVTHNLDIAARFSRCFELRDGTLTEKSLIRGTQA
jgi:lipoprotein-releasing system ATP-binding protein